MGIVAAAVAGWLVLNVVLVLLRLRATSGRAVLALDRPGAR